MLSTLFGSLQLNYLHEDEKGRYSISSFFILGNTNANDGVWLQTS
jgi:hypothetical protein